LVHGFVNDSDVFRVSWTVDAKKLRSSDKVAVSPSFSLPTIEGSFRMMLCPTATSDRKGGASFKKAKGRGKVHVKCEAAPGDVTSSKLVLRISVGSGWDSGRVVAQELCDGGVVHDFAESGVCCLPRHHEECHFMQAVDEASQTFAIFLETCPFLV